jgi:hypothetical protein
MTRQARWSSEQQNQKTWGANNNDSITQVMNLELNFLSSTMKNTLAGGIIDDVRNIRELCYGDRQEKISAGERLGTEVIGGVLLGGIGKFAPEIIGGLAPSLSRFGLWGGSGAEAESVETIANKALNRVRQEEFSATGPNAADALTRKYKALEGAQSGAVRTETLSDGRIRYYDAETPARNPGPTRGSAYVTEYNSKTGDLHTWMESYDQLGNVNRMHLKMYDGQTLLAPHYPQTLKDKLEAELYSGYRRR